jgi:hypothetical protein
MLDLPQVVIFCAQQKRWPWPRHQRVHDRGVAESAGKVPPRDVLSETNDWQLSAEIKGE